MPARTALLFAGVIAAAALAVTGCSSGTPNSTPTAPAGGGSTATPVGPETPTPSSSATTPPSASGCAPTTATMPAGATSRKIGDVDGDGKPDTEWLSASPSLRFGVTTASGATFSYALSTASPAGREGFVTALNDHRIVSIVDDNRTAYVHFLVNCAWVTPHDSHGVQYTFDMNDFHGNGTGVGCSGGYLVGYQVTKTGTGNTVTQTKILLNGDGSVASNGPTSTVVANASSSDPRVKVATEISCGTVTVANAGVSLTE